MHANDDARKRFGALLLRCIKRKESTKKALGRKVGVTGQMVGRYCRGERMPRKIDNVLEGLNALNGPHLTEKELGPLQKAFSEAKGVNVSIASDAQAISGTAAPLATAEPLTGEVVESDTGCGFPRNDRLGRHTFIDSATRPNPIMTRRVFGLGALDTDQRRVQTISAGPAVLVRSEFQRGFSNFLLGAIADRHVETQLRELAIFSSRIMVEEAIEDLVWLQAVPRANELLSGFKYDANPSTTINFIEHTTISLDRLRFCSIAALKDANRNPSIGAALHVFLDETVPIVSHHLLRLDDLMRGIACGYSAAYHVAIDYDEPRALAARTRFLHCLELAHCRLFEAGIQTTTGAAVIAALEASSSLDGLQIFRDDPVVEIQALIVRAKHMVMKGQVDNARQLLETYAGIALQRHASRWSLNSIDTIVHYPVIQDALTRRGTSARLFEYTSDAAWGNLHRTLGEVYVLLAAAEHRATDHLARSAVMQGAALRKVFEHFDQADRHYRRASMPCWHGRAHVLAGYAMISGHNGDLDHGIKQINAAINLYDLCGDAGNLERMNVVRGSIYERGVIETSIISTV